jgi:syntaxin 5
MQLWKTSSKPMGTYSGSASTYYGRQDSTPLTSWDIQCMEQESGQDQMMQLIPDQDYLRECTEAMEQVESNIVELGTIFNKLAVMVNEHQEMVQRVEDNVDDANTSINLSFCNIGGGYIH